MKFVSKIIAVAFALAFSAVSASAEITVNTGKGTPNTVTVDGVSYEIPVNRICGKSTLKTGKIRLEVGRSGQYVTIAGLKTRITCNGGTGGGNGGSTNVSSGSHTGQTATQVAAGLGLPTGSTGTIDPGKVVNHSGVQDTNHNDKSDDEAEVVTAEGSTQSDAQPEKAEPEAPATDSGNESVDIF
jgi:hypothetical protein